MTEAEARAPVRAHESFDRLEAWIADQPWHAGPAGWLVATDHQGWRFRVRAVSGGISISASAPSSGAPAAWAVPTR